MFGETNSRNYEDDYFGSCLKKQKHDDTGRTRVPRRGPGVAELEKIRLEEQHVISTAAPLPPPEKPPSAVILPTTTKRTGPVYPFSSYFPIGSFPDDLVPPAPVFKRNHDLSSLHYLPPLNLPNQRCYQFIEPPSNQTSCQHYVSPFSDDDEKNLPAKRPWQFIAETRKCNVGPTVTIPRDGNQIKSLDQKPKNHFQDSGTTTRNPITIDSPSPATLLTQPIMPNFSIDFPHFRHYEQKEGFNHDIMRQRNGADISSNRKPFYIFLSSNEQSTHDQDVSFSLKTEGTDHGIDLRLKL